MTASPVVEILEDLEAKGVRFRLDGEKIKAALPETSTPVILQALEALRAQRDEVRRVILGRAANKSEKCLHCGGEGHCGCANCGHYVARVEWAAGDCRVCDCEGIQPHHVQ